jgi:hypothetical protein
MGIEKGLHHPHRLNGVRLVQFGLRRLFIITVSLQILHLLGPFTVRKHTQKAIEQVLGTQIVLLLESAISIPIIEFLKLGRSFVDWEQFFIQGLGLAVLLILIILLGHLELIVIVRTLQHLIELGA